MISQFRINLASCYQRCAGQVSVAAMEWYPSDKMTNDDLKAVLMSWRIEIPHKASKDALQKLVGKEFKAKMQSIYGYAPIVRSVRPAASSSCAAASDKSVGTDLPAVIASYIGSEAGSDAGSDLIINELIINRLISLPNKPEATQSAACDDEETHEVDDAGNVVGKLPDKTPASTAAAGPEVTQSAACAAEEEYVPSLRRAVEMEILATAEAKMAKKTVKAEKASKKKPANLYGYLPISAVFIDADQKKKDGDKDSGDVVV